MSKEDALKVLMADYAQHTEEIRDLIKSMDLNMQVCVVLLAAIIAAAARADGPLFMAGLKLEPLRLLVLVPTVMFFFGMVHLMKAGSANAHGDYRNSIAVRIREVAGDQNLLLWADLENTSKKLELVHIGFYFVFAAMALIYGWCAWLVYPIWQWTAYLHIFYVLVMFTYGFVAMRLNTDGPKGAANRKRVAEALKTDGSHVATAGEARPTKASSGQRKR